MALDRNATISITGPLGHAVPLTLGALINELRATLAAFIKTEVSRQIAERLSVPVAESAPRPLPGRLSRRSSSPPRRSARCTNRFSSTGCSAIR
jgi:hypothetical protein